MTSKEIRASFLKYFERNGHRIVPSSPLVPHGDPTLLFTNAGMNQFKDTLLGKETREYRRATTAQKCMRVSGKHNDLENVGPSLRHHTFFEMLGNFSFGDYFRKEAIPFAWTLLTEEWKIPQDRLFVTVFRGESGIPRDDEAYDLWSKYLPLDRLRELGSDDNFWTMGDTGPCGRCSEIYFHRGAEVPCAEEAAGTGCRGVECSCDRYVEIWNNVFMEFDRQPDGTLNPLPALSIDTGMGLERVTAVLQGKLSNYDTDAFALLLDRIGELAGLSYPMTAIETQTVRLDVPAATDGPEAVNTSMRVVADHMRATTFLVADDVFPSNEGRGYVLRKIMRRAMRHGKRLGLERPLLHLLVDTVVDEYGQAYPELTAGRDRIRQKVLEEERRFDSLIASGLPRLDEVLSRAATQGGKVSGDEAFKLYDTYGLPRDFIEDMVESRRLTLDSEGFQQAMESQRKKARAGSKFVAPDVAVWKALEGKAEELARAGDSFQGYDATELETQIVGLFDTSHQEVESLKAGESGFIALSATPFYLESGGQVSDIGSISGAKGLAQVTGVLRGPDKWPRLHSVNVVSDVLKRRDFVIAHVTTEVRDATRRNHTATHLLHAALRSILGPEVKQKGSLVAPDRLRFDFLHSNPVTREQQIQIERLVNEQVMKNTPVQTESRNTEEAIAAGAMALFGEKYGAKVRVVSIPGFSQELCGGTHVRATGDIGPFLILSESGVAAGVRRIEAITGMHAVQWAQATRHSYEELLATIAEQKQLRAALEALRNAVFHIDTEGALAGLRGAVVSVSRLQEDSKRLGRELQQAKMKLAIPSGRLGVVGGVPTVSITGPVLVPEDGEDIGEGRKLVRLPVGDLDRESLRALVDSYRDRIKSGVVVLASHSDGKVSIVVGVTPDLTKRIPAGQVVKQLAPIVGGGGGGRPDFAEAGGKDASKIGEMLAASRGVIEKMLSSS